MATSTTEATLDQATESSEEEESETESGEETEESETSEEDVEPKLRYDRITNDIKAILNKDCASCMAVHSKFLALGTHWGNIYVLDYLGNNIQGKDYQSHTTTVNQISVDDNGDFIASCSDDGKVNISGLYTSDNNQVINFDRPVKAVALDPVYEKSGGKQFVTGDDKLVLNERGYFGRHKTHTLHQGEGPIREIKWKGPFIAWANDLGVKIYDMTLKSRITYVPKEHEHRADQYHCCLHWKDERTLLIGWADTVKVCVVKDREQQDVRDLPVRYVEIISMFRTDFFVCGIAGLDNTLVLLTYDKEVKLENGRQMASRPNLRIISPGMDSFEEVSNDALSIKGYVDYRCNDYHLESIDEEKLFYVISPKDIVVARPRDQDDHITWLLDHGEFEEAMEATTMYARDLKTHTFQDVGRQYLNSLIEDEEFDEAARLCVKIFGKNKDLWEAEAYKFAKIHQLKALAPYLPREDPTLGPAIYEMVLNEFLHTDTTVFLQLVKEWPHTLYSIQTIIKAVLDRLERDRSNRTLLQALAELHSYEKAFDKALAIYLRLKHKDVFVLIHKHNLFETISDKIVQLMEFDEDQAVSMLIDNIKKIPVEKVVHQLEKRHKYLHIYLDQLFKKDPQLTIPYAGQMVKLYAEFERPKLLPFLRTSNHYQLDMALEEVKTREFTREQVFLLGRMGNMRQALNLITEKLQDVQYAIDFCKEHDDRELWQDLINHSIDKPSFITGLLNSVGTHINPFMLIPSIKEGMTIPGLRDSLVRILQDYNLQISLREGCKKILVADSFNLMARLVKTQKKAISVETSNICSVCQERILVNDLRYASDITVFFCSHVVHQDCLDRLGQSCPICTVQRRGPGSNLAIGK